MKPITNLAVTGITTFKQMRKLTKITNTRLLTNSLYENRYGIVFYGASRAVYMDYRDQRIPLNAIQLTWDEFLAKYDKPSCADKLKQLKKQHKLLKKQLKKPWSTDDLADKDLVWCWDDDYTHTRILRFWDKQHTSTFLYDGSRYGSTYTNYKPYVGKWPKWAKKAHKTLKD